MCQYPSPLFPCTVSTWGVSDSAFQFGLRECFWWDFPGCAPSPALACSVEQPWSTQADSFHVKWKPKTFPRNTPNILQLLAVIQSMGPNQSQSEPASPAQTVSLHRSALMLLHLLLMKTCHYHNYSKLALCSSFCFKRRDLFIHWAATMRRSKVPQGIDVSAKAKMIFLPGKHLFSFGSPVGIAGQPSLS